MLLKVVWWSGEVEESGLQKIKVFGRQVSSLGRSLLSNEDGKGYS